MYLSALTWLATAAAVVGMVMLDAAPTDPVRTSRRPDDHTSQSVGVYESVVVVYGSADRDPALVAKVEDAVGYAFGSLPQPGGLVNPAARLAALGGRADNIRAVTQALQALGQASDQNLDAPVLIYTDSPVQDADPFGSMPWPTLEAQERASKQGLDSQVQDSERGTSKEVSLACAGVLPLEAASSTFDWQFYVQGEFTYSGDKDALFGSGVSYDAVAGALLIVGDERDIARTCSRWRAAQCLVDDRTNREFCSTHALNDVFSKWNRDDDLMRLLKRRFGEIGLQRGPFLNGIVCQAPPVIREEVRQFLSDPRLIRLAQESTGSWSRRAAAWRAAVLEDDPVLADFVAACMIDRMDPPPPGAVQLPAELLEAWPQRTSLHACLPTAVFDVLGRLAPKEVARQVVRMAKTSADTDGLWELLAILLRDDAREVRAAAEAVCSTYLVRHVLRDLSESPAWYQWSEPERDALVNELIDRLRAEVREGDAGRALEVAKDLTLLNAEFNADFVSDDVDSRIIELSADLAFDQQHGRAFRRLARQEAIAEAATERLRHSDPEMRWAAGLLLGAWDPSWGDLDRFRRARKVLAETGEFPAFDGP